MAGESVLLIDRGDPPSLAVAAAEGDRSRVIAWHQLEPDDAAQRRRLAVETHVEALGLHRMLVSDPPVIGVRSMAPPSVAIFLAHTLLQAVSVARQVGCKRIIWSEQVGPSPGDVGDRVLLANRVAELAGPVDEPVEIVIDLPLIDLTDTQVVDLIDDGGAPFEACWPCDGAGAEGRPCGGCGGCRRWEDACQAAGVLWPWGVAAVAKA